MCLSIAETGASEFFGAFAKAQAEMGDVLKVATNPASKTRYADLAAVVEAVMPALSKHGLALIQAPEWDGEQVSVETIIAHSGGGMIRSTFKLRPTKVDPQGLGSAITYGRRYALMALCGVAPEDDDGNSASGEGQGGKRFDEPSREQSRQEQKTAPPTLAERANRLGAALKACTTLQALNGTYDSAAVLRADLKANAAGILAEIDKLTTRLSTTLPTENKGEVEADFPGDRPMNRSADDARADAEKVFA